MKRGIFARFLSNALLAALGVLFAALVIEGFVFRLLFLAPDIPRPEFRDSLIKYRPVQSGTYRVKNEIAARYSINEDGWNSTIEKYTAGTSISPVIAVIGDSYVESLTVDVDQSFAEKLAGLLPSGTKVYRFGISGAPLSQYLEMFRRAAIPMRPTLAIINLVHNDFDESYAFKPGIYTSSFLKLKLDGEKIEEIQPKAFEQPWFAPIRSTATWRFLMFRQGIRFQALRNLILGQEKETFKANIDPTIIERDRKEIRIATKYLMHQIAVAAKQQGINLLFTMDGDRQAIYAGEQKLAPDSPLHLNALASTIAAEEEISFLDLHPMFLRDYQSNGKKFNFESDFHWNEYGHDLVAREIRSFLDKNKSLLQARRER